MNINSTPKGSSGYFYCAHCQENVSESTFRRRQVMSNKLARTRHQNQNTSSSSSDSESETTQGKITTFVFKII